MTAVPGGIATRVQALGGTLQWQGSGAGAEASGSGRLATRFTIASWPGAQVALEAEATLDQGRVSVTSFHGATRSLEVAGSGSWSPGAGFSGRVEGTAGDLAQLVPPGKIALGGSGRFEGEFAADAQGPRFTGSVQLAQATVGALRGVGGSARLATVADGVRLTEGTVAWPGGRGSVSGTLAVPSGRIDLLVVLQQFSLQDAARLLGTDPRLLEGTLEARLRLHGTTDAPEVEGEISGRALRYRAVALDDVALSLSYAARRMAISRLRLRRGSTEVTFRGALGEGQVIEGEFESQAFDLADFSPPAGLELTGSVRGQVRGRLDDPRFKGTMIAERLRYGGFDFKGGELSVDYGAGTAAVEGWIAARENRLRAAVEPARDWRFESDLELRQFAPELVRSGLGAFPPALAKALGRAAFLATGRVHGSGRLRDPGSVRADLQLDTLWLQAAGTSLQNLAPVRISWRDAGLVVEDFRLANELYHVSVRGGGGIEKGWNLQVEGAVNLSVFKEYWREIEDVDGRGDLTLTLGGPWKSPHPEGSLTVHEAFVRVRSLPEPLEQLGGRLELRGRTLTATGLSGTMSGGAFRAGGSYQFAQDHLEAQVDGRLDLSLFRGRIPAARDLRGPVEARLRMAGPLTAPVFSGEVDILGAEMFLRPFPAKITNLRGAVLVGTERVEIRELSGQTGGGTVRLTGTMNWASSPVRVDAELEGKGILVSLAGALKAQSDLQLGLHGDFHDLKLAGEVHILKARYLREFNEKLPPLNLSPGPAATTGGKGPDLARMALDVKVSAADNVWVDNRMAKVETAVALQIGGRLGAPVVSGEISGIQGEAVYLSRQFRLESGSLRFVPPSTVPLLDVQASTSVGETQIFFCGRPPQQTLLPPDLPAGSEPAGSRRAADDRGDAQRAGAPWRARRNGGRRCLHHRTAGERTGGRSPQRPRPGRAPARAGRRGRQPALGPGHPRDARVGPPLRELLAKSRRHGGPASHGSVLPARLPLGLGEGVAAGGLQPRPRLPVRLEMSRHLFPVRAAGPVAADLSASLYSPAGTPRRATSASVLLCVRRAGCVAAGAAGAPRVAAVMFAPSDRIGSYRYADIVAVRAGDPLTPDLLERNLRLLRATGLFIAADALLIDAPDGTNVLFTLQPHLLVKEVRVKGNFLVLERDLSGMLKLRPAEPYSEKIVRGDIERVLRHYEEQGYEGTTVNEEISRQAGEVRVTYRIVEGRPRVVRDVLLRGNRGLGEAEVLEAFGMSRYTFFRGSDLQRGLDNLRDYYQRRGYLDVRVGSHVEASEGSLAFLAVLTNPIKGLLSLCHGGYRLVTITVDIDEGRRFEAVFRGVTAFAESDLRPLLTFQRSGFFDEEEVAGGRERILAFYQQQGYYLVEVDAKADYEAGQVVYTVRENQPRAGRRGAPGRVHPLRAGWVRQRLDTRASGGDEGRLLQAPALERDRLRIQSWYRDAGFTRAEVPPPEVWPEAGPAGAVVMFTVREGPRSLLRAISFAGAVALSRARLLAVAGLSEGAPYRAADLQPCRGSRACRLCAGRVFAVRRDGAPGFQRGSHQRRSALHRGRGPAAATRQHRRDRQRADHAARHPARTAAGDRGSARPGGPDQGQERDLRPRALPGSALRAARAGFARGAAGPGSRRSRAADRLRRFRRGLRQRRGFPRVRGGWRPESLRYRAQPALEEPGQRDRLPARPVLPGALALQLPS